MVTDESNSPDDEVFIDATTEEIFVLTELLDLPPLPGLGADSLSEATPADDDDPLRQAALSSLRTRSIVGTSPENPVDDSMAEILTIMAKPGLLVAVSTERGNQRTTRLFGVMPEVSVEQRPIGYSLFRFTPFASRDLLARLLHHVDLRPFEPEQDLRLRVERSTMVEAQTAVRAGRSEAVAETLAAQGNDPGAANALVSALITKRSASSVTIVYRPSVNSVQGGTLSWIDAGLGGLWVSEPDPGGDDALTVSLRSARSVAAELLSYLPAEFARFPAVV